MTMGSSGKDSVNVGLDQPWANSREFSEQLSEFDIPSAVLRSVWLSIAKLASKAKKETWGGNKNVRVKKKSLKGQRKTPPPQTKGPGRCPHSGEGRARSPTPASARSRGGPCKTWAAAKQKGKTTTRHKKQRNTLAASRPKKGLGRGERAQAP